MDPTNTTVPEPNNEPAVPAAPVAPAESPVTPAVPAESPVAPAETAIPAPVEAPAAPAAEAPVEAAPAPATPTEAPATPASSADALVAPVAPIETPVAPVNNTTVTPDTTMVESVPSPIDASPISAPAAAPVNADIMNATLNPPVNPVVTPTEPATAPAASGGAGSMTMSQMFQSAAPAGNTISETTPLTRPEGPKAPDPVEEELKAPLKAAAPVPGSIGSSVSVPPDGQPATAADPTAAANNPMAQTQAPAKKPSFLSKLTGPKANGSKMDKKSLIMIAAIAGIIVVVLVVVLVMMLGK